MRKYIAVLIPILFLFTTSADAMDRYVSYLLDHNSYPPQLLRLTFSCESETSCWSNTLQTIATLDPAIRRLTRAPRGTYHALNHDDDTLLTLDIRTGDVLDALRLAESTDENTLLAYDAQNRPWLLVENTLARIDPETGVTVQQTVLDTTLAAMSFHQESLLAAEGTRILEIDTDTGDIEELANNSSIWGAAWVLVLASDAEHLWVLVDSAAEPGPATHFAMMQLDPMTGNFVAGSAVAYFQSGAFDCQGLSVRSLKVPPDHTGGEQRTSPVLE